MLELAPAPAVDDEPKATMVIGSPLAILRATCLSGADSLTKSCGGLHGGVPCGSALADSGIVIDTTAIDAKTKRAASGLTAREARLIACTV